MLYILFHPAYVVTAILFAVLGGFIAGKTKDVPTWLGALVGLVFHVFGVAGLGAYYVATKDEK